MTEGVFEVFQHGPVKITILKGKNKVIQEGLSLIKEQKWVCKLSSIKWLCDLENVFSQVK